MSIDPVVFNVSRRRFLAAAGGVTAATSLAAGGDAGFAPDPPAPPPPSPANYVVTVDVTTSPISYSIPGHNAYRLKVNTNDTITWKATTNGTQHHMAILFVKETPLIDTTSKKPKYAVHGTESDDGTPAMGGGIHPDASGVYEYYVAIFDKVTNSVVAYTDDPKIIVGGSGTVETKAEIAELTEAKGELQRVISSSRPEEREKLESVEKKLEQIIDQLK